MTERGRRTVIHTSYTLEALRSHRVGQATRRLALGPAYIDHDLIFARDDGSPWPPNTISKGFAALVRRAKFPHLRLHDLRHTHATQLLRQGVHPKIVSERLGHSHIGINLDTTSHVLLGMQEGAIASIDAALRAAFAVTKHRSD